MNLLLPLLALLGGAACVLGQSQTITEIAEGNADFSTLATALALTDLDDLLDCTSWRCRSVTVFAPTNAAFDLLPADLLGNLTQNPEYLGHLRGILLYHVIYREVAASQIVDGGTLYTLLPGTSVNTTISGGNVFINSAQVTTPDVQASNGVVHVINSVLLPPFMTRTIAQVAQETSFLSTLVTALDTAGLVSALDGPGPFTVFAPTNDAFSELGDAVVNDLLANVTALTDILTYHVIPGRIITASDLDEGTLTTLQGEDITVGYRGYWFFAYPILNGEVRFAGFDILASNGVVHVITDVLIPPTSSAPGPTIFELAQDDSRLSTLVAALEATGLNDTLNTAAGPLTLFAPTDRAFEELGSATVNDLLANPDRLSAILQYHVVPGRVTRGDLSDGELTTLTGDTIQVDVRGFWFWVRYYLNRESRIVEFNNEATNGVVHLISEVLTPPGDIVSVVQNGGFSRLAAALASADLISALQAPGPFTVFAPTDEAFEDLGSALDSLSTEALTQILLYHVVSGEVRSGDLSEGTVNTLQNEPITISRNCRFFFCGSYELNDGVDFEDVDIDATNGVIHSIEEVLIPPSLAGSI